MDEHQDESTVDWGPGREGSLFGLPPCPDPAAVVILAPLEATVSYGGGTAGGPGAALRASSQLDLYDEAGGDGWQRGVGLSPADPPYAEWNERAARLLSDVRRATAASQASPIVLADQVDALVREAVEHVQSQVAAVLDSGRIPAVLGGEHTVALAGVKAASRARPVSVLQIDAHADLRPDYEGLKLSHACVARRILEESGADIVQVAVRDRCRAEAAFAAASARVRTFSDADLNRSRRRGEPFGRVAARIVESLGPSVWITLDVDGLEPGLCPGTGTPVPGGLSWWEFDTLLCALADSGKRVVGLDICEIGPGEWDGNVAARALLRMLNIALGHGSVIDGRARPPH